MKIIASDNFARETHSDELVCEGVNQYWGTKIADLLNQDSGKNGRLYFRLVHDDHVLYVWEP